MVAVPTIQPNIRARRAVSVVTTAAFDGKLSVAEVSIETGRTHQIRVHLQVNSRKGGDRRVFCFLFFVFDRHIFYRFWRDMLLLFFLYKTKRNGVLSLK